MPADEWESWEREFIRWYRVLGWNVVNTEDGGEGGPREVSAETRAKISAANRGQKRSEAYRKYLRDKYANGRHPCLGRTLSPEHKAALSASLKGKPKSAETRARMSASGGRHLRGKPLSDEHRAKLSASKKGRTQAAEHSAKIGAALKGKPKSDEARRRMSIAAKARCERQRLTSSQNGGSLQPLPTQASTPT